MKTISLIKQMKERHFAAQAKLNNVEMLQQVLVKMQYCNASATQVASAKIIFNNNNKRCSKAHKRFFTCKKVEILLQIDRVFAGFKDFHGFLVASNSFCHRNILSAKYFGWQLIKALCIDKKHATIFPMMRDKQREAKLIVIKWHFVLIDDDKLLVLLFLLVSHVILWITRLFNWSIKWNYSKWSISHSTDFSLKITSAKIKLVHFQVKELTWIRLIEMDIWSIFLSTHKPIKLMNKRLNWQQ